MRSQKLRNDHGVGGVEGGEDENGTLTARTVRGIRETEGHKSTGGRGGAPTELWRCDSHQNRDLDGKGEMWGPVTEQRKESWNLTGQGRRRKPSIFRQGKG